MNKLLALLLLVPAISFGAVIQGSQAPAEAASAVPASQPVQEKLMADLQQAISEANAAHDAMAPVRAKCYQTLLNHVSTLSDPAKPIGPISAFEVAAEVAEGADAGVPLDIRVDCAPLQVRARDILIKFGLGIKVIK